MPTIAEVRQKYPQYSDMSDDQLAKALHSKFYADIPYEDFAAKIGMAKSATKPESTLEQVASALPGGKYGLDAFMGARQALDAAAQFAARKTGLGVESTEAANKAAKDAYDATNPDARAGSGLVRAAFNSLPAMAIPTGRGAGLAGLGKAVLSGAAGGAVSGALEPVYDVKDDADYNARKLAQVKDSAMVGGGAGGAMNLAGKIIAPVLGEGQKLLASKGVGMTPGQQAGGIVKGIEDRLSGFPVIGDLINKRRLSGIIDFNRAVYSEALSPFGEEGAKVVAKAKPGREGIKEIGDFLSAKYEAALAKSGPSPIDDAFVASLEKLKTMVPYDKMAQFDRHLSNVLTVTPGNTIAPSVAKRAQSELGRLASEYRGSSVASEREYGQALAQAAREVRALFARNNPETAAAIKAADKGWSTLAEMENAGSMIGARDGLFTPAQFLNAVKRSDKSIRDRTFARGDALNQDLAEAAKNVLPSQVPDSGTAGRVATGALLGGGAGHLLGFDPTTMAIGSLAALPYLPGVGPMLNLARQSPIAAKLRDIAMGLVPLAGATAGSVSASQ